MAQTNYDITFSLDGGVGVAPTSGAFTYDATTQTFSNFDVVFGGATYDLTSAANAPTINGPIPGPCSGVSGGLLAFMILDAECNTAGPFIALWESSDQGNPAQPFVFIDYFNIHGTENTSITGAPPAGATSTNTDSDGGWTISVAPAVSLPEPGALMILFANLAVMAFLARKRIALGYRQYMRTTCEPPLSQ